MSTFSTTVNTLKLCAQLHAMQLPTELHISSVLWGALVYEERKCGMVTRKADTDEIFYMGLRVVLDDRNPSTLGVR